jgi:hypothetical protein
MHRIFLGLLLSLFTAGVLAQSHELVYWTSENTASYSYPQSGIGLASEISSASQSYLGLDIYDDNRNVWTNTSTAGAVTWSSSSYLSFTVALNEAITIDRFVIHGAACYPNEGVAMQLRCSLDNFTNSLGNFTPGGSSYNLTSVDLSAAGIIAKDEIEFRVYYYAVSGNVFHSDTGPYTSLDATPEYYTSHGRCFSILGDSAPIEELAYWGSENTVTCSYPQAADGNSALVLAASQNYSGLDPYDDSRNVWTNPSAAAEVDPLTSPYLSYGLTLNEVVKFDRFVVHGAAPYPTLGVSMQLRWSGDNFTTSLGEFTPGKSDFNLTSVDLSNTGLFGMNEVEFRIYFYNVAGNVFFSSTGPYTTTDGTLPFYTSYGRAFSLYGEKSCHTASVIEVTECNGYVSPSGRYTWTSSGTYRDTIPNSAGCDSLITIDLTILKLAAGIDTKTACGSYTWMDGITYTESNNSAVFNIFGGAANGCDSLVQLDLTINRLENIVVQSGDTLRSLTEGAVYQWIDCSTKLPVENEISQTFIAKANGDYALALSLNACTDTSVCFAVTTVGIAEPAFGGEFFLYPNPGHGSLKIDLGESYPQIYIKIMGIDGQLISLEEYINRDQIDLSIDGAAGIYFIEVFEPSGKRVVLKAIKE